MGNDEQRWTLTVVLACTDVSCCTNATNPSAVFSFKVFVLPTLMVGKFSFRNTFSCNNPTSLPGKKEECKKKREINCKPSTCFPFFPFSLFLFLFFSPLVSFPAKGILQLYSKKITLFASRLYHPFPYLAHSSLIRCDPLHLTHSPSSFALRHPTQYPLVRPLSTFASLSNERLRLLIRDMQYRSFDSGKLIVRRYLPPKVSEIRERVI